MLRVKSCAHMIPCACTHLSSTLSRLDRLIGFTSAYVFDSPYQQPPLGEAICVFNRFCGDKGPRPCGSHACWLTSWNGRIEKNKTYAGDC